MSATAVRLKAAMQARGIGPTELARLVGVRQGTISKIASGRTENSRYLVKIARELRTTSAYLSGEIDDPDEGASAPPPSPRHQPLLLPVMLPSEAALAAAFQGVLRASQRMDAAELARELARRLPTVLRLSATAIVEPASDADDDLPEPDEPHADAHRVRRRA